MATTKARERMLLVVAGLALAVLVARRGLARPQADPLDPVLIAGETHGLAFENAF